MDTPVKIVKKIATTRPTSVPPEQALGVPCHRQTPSPPVQQPPKQTGLRQGIKEGSRTAVTSSKRALLAAASAKVEDLAMALLLDVIASAGPF